MNRSVNERPLRTIALALLGFGALMIAVPEWARAGVLVFAAIVAVLAYAVDPSVRGALRRDDAKPARAKSPAARRAAT